MPKRFHYGGQAVLEGVMMRGPKKVKVAVRQSDGQIITITEPLNSIYTGPLRKIPLLRGIIALVETLVLGIRALLFSAKIAAEEEWEGELKSIVLWIPVFLGIVFGMALFVALPLLITHYGVDRLTESAIISNIADGVIRIIVFIVYLSAMSLLPDIRRVFAYHGAEHKTVNGYERGSALVVSEIQKYSTAHTRCGTGFLLIVLVLAIIAFAFLGQPPIWIRFLLRLLLLPVIAAIGYEIIQFAADHTDNFFIRVIMAPSLALQSLTTRQPDDEQVEVAISALQDVIEPETS